jgi:hemoglobin
MDDNPTTENEQFPQWGWGGTKGPYEVAAHFFKVRKPDREGILNMTW